MTSRGIMKKILYIILSFCFPLIIFTVAFILLDGFINGWEKVEYINDFFVGTQYGYDFMLFSLVYVIPIVLLWFLYKWWVSKKKSEENADHVESNKKDED
jgi:hypothetical protein